MEPYTVFSSQKQMPTVKLDPETGIFIFSGQCYMDNAEAFFSPLIGWMEEYLAITGRDITFEMQLEYFNTSSAKCLWEIFIRLERYQKEMGGCVSIRWHFEDEDEASWELFEDFKAEVGLNFTHVNPIP